MLRRAALVIILAVPLAIPALAAEGADSAGKQRPRVAKAQLQPFRSCAALVRYARRNVRRGPGFFPPPVGGIVPPPPRRIDSPTTAPMPPLATAPGAESDQSQTNVQEQGVDEPDVVKAAGGRIFAVAGGQLHAIDAAGPRLLGSLPLDGYSHELLLHGKRLLVISQHGSGESGSCRRPRRDILRPGYAPHRGGRERSGEADGGAHPACAGRVRERAPDRGDRTRGRDQPAARGGRARAAPAPEGLARAHHGGQPLTGNKRTRPATRCRAVRRAQVFSGLDMLTVLTIDMDRGLPEVDSDAVMTGAELVYASPRRLYVATQRFVPQSSPEQDIHGGTTIHEFDASDTGETTYRASGTVPGFLLNQWAMSERGGVLRVASSEAPTWLGGARPRVRAS